MAKKEAPKTLRTELIAARSSIHGLQRLKAVLPMVEAQREAIECAMASIRFAWRNHKLETKVGDTMTLSDYAGTIVRTSLPLMKWQGISAGKLYKTKRAPK